VPDLVGLRDCHADSLGVHYSRGESSSLADESGCSMLAGGLDGPLLAGANCTSIYRYFFYIYKLKSLFLRGWAAGVWWHPGKIL
jgi:hypothetical protein